MHRRETVANRRPSARWASVIITPRGRHRYYTGRSWVYLRKGDNRRRIKLGATGFASMAIAAQRHIAQLGGKALANYQGSLGMRDLGKRGSMKRWGAAGM